MVMPGNDKNTDKDLANKSKGGKELLAKMVKVDELEVSFEKTLERTHSSEMQSINGKDTPRHVKRWEEPCQ